MFSLLVVLLLVRGVSCSTKDTDKEDEKLEEKTASEPGVGTEPEEKTFKEKLAPVEMYKKLFQKHRHMQLEAVKRIQSFEDYAKMYKLVDKMLTTLFQVLSAAKVNVTEMGYLPGDPFPENVTVREAVALILENTAMFGDMVLRLPDVVHAIYKKHNEWRLIISWAVWFCNESSVYDGTHKKLIHLMSQELDLIPKEEGYINPYRDKSSKEAILMSTDEMVRKVKDKKKIKEAKKGPRMTGVHTEL